MFKRNLTGVLLTLYEGLCANFTKKTAQFPCIPCSYCSRLLYPHSVKWVIKDDNFVYPLQSSFPQLNIIANPRNESKIAVCDGCKSNRNNRLCYVLAEIPQCIHDVPYAKRKYLSSVYLHTSLGRSAGANPLLLNIAHSLGKWVILETEER